jgi:RNA polymerase sigma factor (sigma-70 family)
MSLALSVSQPAPSCTEHELVAAVRRGSDEAFEALYARYSGRIRSYIFGRVHDHARAEDIAQDVFISALRRLRESPRPIEFKPWVYEIAKNACIDEFRRSRRLREVPLLLDGEATADHGHEHPARQAAHAPDSVFESKQSLADLRGAFHGLSESHHKVIVMRELEGLSYTQIGERMGMTRAMVESTLFRARRRLSQEYDELVSGRRCGHVQTLISEEPQVLAKVGVRVRRQMARHLSHCQPCRRHARMAGLDESFFKAPSLGERIAALLPIPWFWLRRARRGHGASAPGSRATSIAKAFHNAARFVDPAGPVSDLGRAAGAAAVVVVAALGGGVASTLGGSSPQPLHRVVPAAVVIATPASPSVQPRGRHVPLQPNLGPAATRAPRSKTARGTGRRAAGGAVQAVHAGSGSSGSRTPRSGSGQSASSTNSRGAGSSSSGGSAGPTPASGGTPTNVKVPLVGAVPVSVPKPPPLPLPRVTLPKVSVPKVTVPKVTVPTVSVPSPKKVLGTVLKG